MLINVYLYLDEIKNKSEELKMEMDKITEKKNSIVILATTLVEMKELLKSINECIPRFAVKEKFLKNLVCRELVGCNPPVYIVQTQMGTSGIGSTISTMHTVISELNPNKVIMGGIAFGCNKEKQRIGDILVAKQVWCYEPAKIKGDENISRGDKSTASNYLLQIFESSAIDYKNEDVRIKFGLFASGEKLINSENFINNLKHQEPEIIGGDMEACGLLSVCNEKKIDWLVVKAICDWGYDKDDSKQQLAAHNSFDFIIYNLKKIIDNKV